MTHRVKIWPKFYDEVAGGMKPFELRKDDRNYAVGDELRLEEYDPEMKIYTGRTVTAKVIYKLERMPGLEDGYCVLALGSTRIQWCPALCGLEA